jgi:prephenate dehydrogenase
VEKKPKCHALKKTAKKLAVIKKKNVLMDHASSKKRPVVQVTAVIKKLNHL